MLFRFRLPSLACLALAAVLPLRAANLDGSSDAVGAAEAQRLYDDANDYVANVTEGPYSYAYIQFYWKRAQSFVERIEQVYPDTPTGRALKQGRLKLGPFALDYFRDRVLARLEEKRTYTVDEVSCANFLYELDKKRSDPAHELAFASILEVMARQQRWGEVFAFPARPDQRVTLFGTIYREAVRSRFDESSVVRDLLAHTAPGMQQDAGFWPKTGEAYALLGRPRTEITAFLGQHPQNEVKLAVLHGMVEREVQIRRHAALRLAVQDRIDTAHYSLLNLGVRDDVEAVARQFWPQGEPATTANLLAAYRAALGVRPAAGAALPARLAYLEYLGAFDRFDELASYLEQPVASDSDRSALELKGIEMYAEGGRLEDAARRQAAFAADHPADADWAELSKFRGQINSLEAPLTVREKTFASLPFKDPCILADAIMEWSLTPNRSIRGAAPWDSVVLKYEPGFDNLPLPKSNAVREAASATNPY